MILWSLITGGLFYGANWGTSTTTRSNCGLSLLIWCIASVALAVTGVAGTVD